MATVNRKNAAPALEDRTSADRPERLHQRLSWNGPYPCHCRRRIAPVWYGYVGTRGCWPNPNDGTGNFAPAPASQSQEPALPPKFVYQGGPFAGVRPRAAGYCTGHACYRTTRRGKRHNARSHPARAASAKSWRWLGRTRELSSAFGPTRPRINGLFVARASCPCFPHHTGKMPVPRLPAFCPQILRVW